jgi:serine/threonine-protein kinase RsbW
MTVLEAPMKTCEEITFESTSSNISIVEKVVNDVCARHEVNEDHYGNLLIALTEAVNNAIKHGNGEDPTKTVNLEYSATSELLEFRIKDQGVGFDFNNLPDPTDPENIEKANGRGVFLMKNLADEVNFHDEGRTVELKFNLNIN